jgi:hypothetical protein
MFRPVARVASGLVIAPFLLFGSALAPLHVHEPDAWHSHALAHSHLEPHHFESHEPEGTEVERGGERVIWMESAILPPTAYHLSPAPPLVAAIFEEIPLDSSWSPTTFDDVAPVHGPPRLAQSLRAPPISALLI